VKVLRGLIGIALAASALPARAGMFDDDEARKRIEDLRAQVQTMQKAFETRFGSVESQVQDRRALIDLSALIDALRQDIARLRGQMEVLANQVEQADRRQKDLYADLDGRLRKFEQARAEAEKEREERLAREKKEQEAAASEARSYESALNQYKAGGYQNAIQEFQAFITAYPNSTLVPSAQYWTGNAYYAVKDYKAAINALQRVVTSWPDNPRASDAMLNIASSQAELGDAKSERNTLRELIDRYPKSSAADQAKQRLARRPAPAAH